MPDPVTVSNSSCLIALDLVGRLDLLHDLRLGLAGPGTRARRSAHLSARTAGQSPQGVAHRGRVIVVVDTFQADAMGALLVC